MLKPAFPMLALLVGALTASPAMAEKRIETVQRGTYMCELPGNAAGAVAMPQPDSDFRIKSGSRYSSRDGSGIYLFKGGVLQFTSGPRKGERFQVLRSGFMRILESDGEPGRLRCIRRQR